MEDLFNELLQLLEKTTVYVEFDRTKIGYMNYGQDEVDAGIEPNEEDKYFYYTIKVDGYSNLIKYSERVDFLIQEFIKEIESQLNERVYYKNVKAQLEKIKSIVVPIYSNPDMVSFSDQADIRERVLGNKSSYYFEPNIYLKYINGTKLDSDLGEFLIIKKFIKKKFYLARRIEAIAKSNLELLKEQGGGKKLETFKFMEDGLLDSPRFTNFRNGLIENGLIDKIDARLFEKCFSGKEVDEKVNWIFSKLSVVYFLRQLDKRQLVLNKAKWISLSNSFLLKNMTINPKTISHTTALCSKKIRGIIDELINGIASKTPVLPPK